MATMFIALPAIKSYALVTQDTTATAPPDDIVFTEVGSAQDSAANKQVKTEKDTLKKDTVKKVEKAAVAGKDAPKQSLWVTFGLGLLAGIAAFFSSMYFSDGSAYCWFLYQKSRKQGKRNQECYYLWFIDHCNLRGLRRNYYLDLGRQCIK